MNLHEGDLSQSACKFTLHMHEANPVTFRHSQSIKTRMTPARCHCQRAFNHEFFSQRGQIQAILFFFSGACLPNLALGDGACIRALRANLFKHAVLQGLGPATRIAAA